MSSTSVGTLGFEPKAVCIQSLFIIPSVSSHTSEKDTQLTVVVGYGQNPHREATKERRCEGKKKNIYKALSMVRIPEKSPSMSSVSLKAGTGPEQDLAQCPVDV